MESKPIPEQAERLLRQLDRVISEYDTEQLSETASALCYRADTLKQDIKALLRYVGTDL